MGLQDGKKEPDSVRAQQCDHCGLYYTDMGIKSHQAYCPLQPFDVRIQPLENHGSG